MINGVVYTFEVGSYSDNVPGSEDNDSRRRGNVQAPDASVLIGLGWRRCPGRRY